MAKEKTGHDIRHKGLEKVKPSENHDARHSLDNLDTKMSDEENKVEEGTQEAPESTEEKKEESTEESAPESAPEETPAEEGSEESEE